VTAYRCRIHLDVPVDHSGNGCRTCTRSADRRIERRGEWHRLHPGKRYRPTSDPLIDLNEGENQ
jgi:hypothetical protein